MGAKDHWLERSQLRQHPLEWTQFAAQLDGDGFRIFQQELTKYHRNRLEPSLPSARWADELAIDCSVLQGEGEFVEAVRARIKPLASEIPAEAYRKVLAHYAGRELNVSFDVNELLLLRHDHRGETKTVNIFRLPSQAQG